MRNFTVSTIATTMLGVSENAATRAERAVGERFIRFAAGR